LLATVIIAATMAPDIAYITARPLGSSGGEPTSLARSTLTLSTRNNARTRFHHSLAFN